MTLFILVLTGGLALLFTNSATNKKEKHKIEKRDEKKIKHLQEEYNEAFFKQEQELEHYQRIYGPLDFPPSR